MIPNLTTYLLTTLQKSTIHSKIQDGNETHERYSLSIGDVPPKLIHPFLTLKILSMGDIPIGWNRLFSQRFRLFGRIFFGLTPFKGS